MEHQKATILQEMGITHWQVRKPALFKSEAELEQLNLSVCNLLVVCSEEDKLHPLMAAIINAFEIDPDTVQYCNLAQFEAQQGQLPNMLWSTMGKLDVTSNHQLLHSPSLCKLAEQAGAKKLLWEQYCAYLQ